MYATTNGPSAGASQSKTTKAKGADMYKKYAKTSASNWLDPSSKLKPSDLCKSSVDVVADDYPRIIEFNNIKDNSCQVHSTVDIDQPLFQPSPKVVVFEDYAPFTSHEKKLFFRNNDSVARRIKVHPPKTPFFEISAPKTPNGEPLKQTKIAAGMEVCYVITFKPQQVQEYSLELVCSTEREKFVVPVRAVGMQPRMTFPDEIAFGTCAVKSTTRKTLLVQNVGSSVARFFMRTSVNPQSFTCPSEELTVEAGASQMIELFFTPQSAKPIEGEIEVEFVNNKLRCYIAVGGTGRNVDVSLSTPSVALEPSYISLSSQKTMRIKNTSDVPINFVWKSFSSQEEEETERGRLLNEINRMEAIEQSSFQDRLQSGFYDPPASNTGNYSDYREYEETDEMGGDDMSYYSPQARADAATLMRKYRNLRTALENDPMQFVDDIFEISPVSGNVWARSEIEITITFRPDTAAKYTCLGYLDISGRQDRLSLHLSGQGIGPHAALSFDVLDVGDVFINDEQHYDLSITNKGDIPAQWSFLPSLTRFGNKFDFTPKSGYLSAGHSQNIKIRFESDVLGEFSEVFRFALQGNDDVLACQVKGHVIGPTFHFDCGRIDFGIVSFDYLHSTKLKLVNTSKIPMVFHLHVPQDGTFLKKEFDVEPKDGTLGPGQHVNVSIEFIPSSVKVYDYSLAVDVLGVGESLLSVPISAECKVMSLKLVERDIMYGDVFIRYPYERELLLFNPSDVLHTKFEMMPQLTYTKYFASYEAEPSVGVIEPGDTMKVTMRLVADKLANFKMPVLVSIAGSKEPPLTATLQYSCVGPRVKTDVTEIRWGNIDCLRDSSRSCIITNDSLISAHIKIFLKMARSKFELSASEMVLEPGQSYELVITANLDDSVVIKDEVHIVVDEGDDIMIPLSAKGVGTTMFCGHDLNTLDLGVQLTNCTFERKIVLENKGRRVQQLRWVNVTNRDENQNRALKVKSMGKEQNASRLPKHLAPMDPIFTVTPEEITLRPRTATTFTFKGFSATASVLKEVFILESKVGKERAFKQIAMTEVKCNVVNPLLDFSEPRMDFIYTWENGVPALVQRRGLVLRNASDISLTFVLSVENPFNLSSFEHTLQPGEKCDVMVDFDPLYKDDKQSHTVEKMLLVTYRGHPQKDSIPLTAEIIFPNLAFDLAAVAFGCVLNDSTKLIKLTATNVSKVVCTYEWMFQDDLNKAAPKRLAKDKRSSTKRELNTSTALSCEQVFDVMPVRSVLLPGESEEVQFTMFGVGNSKISGSAFCIVEGGPEYGLPLSGEASTVSFALDKAILDFGSVVFTDRKDEEIGIVNNGKVVFSYEVFPLTTSLGEVLEAIPSSGKVSPGEKAKVTLRMRLATPTSISDTVMFKIAHFDPVGVNVYCTGIFPSAVVSLPRHARIGPYGETTGNLTELWEAFTARANDNITQLQQSLSAPPMETLPQPFSATSAAAPMYLPPAPMSSDGTDVDAEMRQYLLDNAPAKSLTSATKGPQQLNMEVEMQRMALCYHLEIRIEETRKKVVEEFEQKQRELLEAEAAAASGATVASGGTNRSNTANSSNNKAGKTVKPAKDANKEVEKEDRGLQALVAKYIDLKEIVTANYICDFGNVIIGQQRKKVFQVCNASQAGHISWVFEKKFLSGSPFSIEPDRVSKLLEMGR
jgi:hydrocephalus-inducing protein